MVPESGQKEEAEVEFMSEMFRRHGVRRENARKNVGKAKFAFNEIQRMLLPKEFQPPKSTTAGLIDSCPPPPPWGGERAARVLSTPEGLVWRVDGQAAGAGAPGRVWCCS